MIRPMTSKFTVVVLSESETRLVVSIDMADEFEIEIEDIISRRQIGTLAGFPLFEIEAHL